jgi:hypothetical protein
MSLDIGTSNSREIGENEADDIARSLFGTASNPKSRERGNDIKENDRDMTVKRIDFNVKNYHIFECEKKVKNLFGFIPRSQKMQTSILILDKFGRVRLSLSGVSIIKGTKKNVLTDLLTLLGSPIDLTEKNDTEKKETFRHSSSNTADRHWDLPPQVHLLDDIRLIDFSNLTSPENLSKVIRDEVQKSSSKDILAVIKK